MKKNKFMRIASVMLMLCVITTCAISGTFAKYTTSEGANDSARVAKWGVVITTEGTLFAEQYKDAPVAADNADNITVQVADAATVEQNVVAPGTKNDTGITFVIDGTAEVDLSLTIAVVVSDISLAAGTYDDYTTGNGEDKFELDAAYNPVKFTLTQNDIAVKTNVTLAEIKAYLEGLSRASIDANTDLGDIYGTYNLTWAWEFGNGTNDKADTYLGKQETPQIISFDITITATQLN